MGVYQLKQATGTYRYKLFYAWKLKDPNGNIIKEIEFQEKECVGEMKDDQI